MRIQNRFFGTHKKHIIAKKSTQHNSSTPTTMGCGRPQMMMVIGNIQSKYGNKPSGDGREKQQKKQ
jgi:hypothetical protein